MSDNYVFISYSTENQSEADAIKGFLNKSGISTWMAPYDIPAGSQYASVINRAIKDCSCLLVILSKASVASTWVDREVERAINFHKTVVPVSIEDVTLNDAFEFYISITQIVRINRVDEAGLRPVVSRLKAVINPTAAVTSGTAPKKAVPETSRKSIHSDIYNSSDTIQPEQRSIQAAAPAGSRIKIMTEGGRQYITLGSYEMERWRLHPVSSGKKQPLSWEVLTYSQDKKRALVLCRNIVVYKPYNETLWANTTWEKCTLRGWLNKDFYETAFQAEERKLIIPTTVSNPDNAKYGTKGGNDTEDRIFLLSLDEAGIYFQNNDARVRRTYDGKGSWWWLRSPGYRRNFAANVYNEGIVHIYGSTVRDKCLGVCPAFWIDLSL